MRGKYLLVSTLIVLSFGILAGKASAGTAVVSWNANSEPDLASYKIYYGISSRTGTDPKVCGTCGYSASINVGKVTSYTFNNLTDGQTYYFSVSAIDTSTNESSFSAEVNKIIPVVDTTAPTISSVTASSISSSGATITWTTNENSDSQVEYGPTASYGSQTTLNTSMVASHTQSLTELQSALFIITGLNPRCSQ